MLARALPRHGCEVFAAEDGYEALTLLQEQPCDALLMDLAMPRCDGFEGIRQIRGDGRPLRIVVMSGCFDGAVLSAAVWLGADAVVRKPFQVVDVLLPLILCGTHAAAGRAPCIACDCKDRRRHRCGGAR